MWKWLLHSGHTPAPVLSQWLWGGWLYVMGADSQHSEASRAAASPPKQCAHFHMPSWLYTWTGGGSGLLDRNVQPDQGGWEEGIRLGTRYHLSRSNWQNTAGFLSGNPMRFMERLNKRNSTKVVVLKHFPLPKQCQFVLPPKWCEWSYSWCASGQACFWAV